MISRTSQKKNEKKNVEDTIRCCNKPEVSLFQKLRNKVLL